MLKDCYFRTTKNHFWRYIAIHIELVVQASEVLQKLFASLFSVTDHIYYKHLRIVFIRTKLVEFEGLLISFKVIFWHEILLSCSFACVFSLQRIIKFSYLPVYRYEFISFFFLFSVEEPL